MCVLYEAIDIGIEAVGLRVCRGKFEMVSSALNGVSGDVCRVFFGSSGRSSSGSIGVKIRQRGCPQ